MADIDSYEFEKSMAPQGINLSTPYQKKDYNYVSDINGLQYSNNSGTTLVTYDLSSLYNSSCLIALSECYLAVPVTYVTTYVDASGNLINFTTGTSSGMWASTGMKWGSHQLVHAIDLQINGKSIEQNQPFLNGYIGWRLLSTMSQTDLKNYGATIGLGDELDNPQSAIFNGSATCTGSGAFPSCVPTGGVGGNGISNNRPFSLGTADAGDQASQGAQYTGCYNRGFYSRLKRIPDCSTNTQPQKFYGTASATGTSFITSVTNLTKEFKPYFTISNNSYLTWYDVMIIRLKDLGDSFNKFPLSRKIDARLQIFYNTGTVVSNVTGSAGLMVTSLSGSTFTNTCPLLQSCLATLPTNSGGPGVVAMCSGLFIGNATTTSLTAGGATGINLASGVGGHFMSSTRFYYPQIVLKPEPMRSYISENRAKKISFTSILTNTISQVSPGATYSQILQAGVSNLKSLIMLPFISNTTNGAVTTMTGITNFSQVSSPFDPAPASTCPISLLNLQVTVGGTNVLSNVLSYSFESFIEQVSIYEKLTSSDFGISVGLINQQYWEANRMYFVDCSRGLLGDLLTPRVLTVSFLNNSLQTIDVICYTEYMREIILDVESGQMSV